MITSDMIKSLCKERNISVAELARRLGQTPQNFNKKLKRDTVTYEEILDIADILDVIYEQRFVFFDGRQIILSNKCIEVWYKK